MKVSIVIPVYNEAAALGTCLQAIAAQSVEPHEVIVVDNNSTDQTVAVAEQFDFVKVISEKRQGVVFARDRGFDLASGDIIGRIDADSLVTPDWVATVMRLFDEDPGLAAVSGSVSYYGLALGSVLDRIDLLIRRRMARLLGREVAMQGANLALRRSVWRQSRSLVCRRGDMHEDHDLSIHINWLGGRVRFNERLAVAIDCRRLESNWLDFCRYALMSPKTYAQHGLNSRRHMYPIVILAILFHLPLKWLRRGYDSETERFSWLQLLSGSAQPRVNPATFVD